MKQAKEKKERQVHSRAYHSYFEGYEERQVLDINGNLKIERKYVGDWYIPDIPEDLRLKKKAFSLISTVLVLAMFFYTVTRPVSANTVWYVALPAFFSFASLVFEAIYLGFSVAAKPKMEVRTYRDSHEKFCRAYLAGAISLALLGLMYPVHMIVSHDFSWKLVLMGCLMLLSALLTFAAYYFENKTKYRTEEQVGVHMPKSAYIRY